MIKAIALDDDPLYLKILAKLCSESTEVELVQQFSTPAEAGYFLENHPIDLIFLDIEMPKVSGIDFYERLFQKPVLVFTTSHGEHALKGFELDATDYLLKPFTPERFEQAVLKVKKQLIANGKQIVSEEESFFVRVDYELKKVVFSEISLVEAMDDYLKIHLDNAKPLVIRMTMKAIAEKLPSHQFMRVHRSFIIPKNRMVSFHNKVITTKEQNVPVGKNYEKEVQEFIKTTL